MHDSFKRLLDFARTATAKSSEPILEPNDLRARMQLSSQAFHNWTLRGVSVPGAIEAEGLFGCPAYWILHGTTPPGMSSAEGVFKVAEQPPAYRVAPSISDSLAALADRLRYEDALSRTGIAPLLAQLAMQPEEVHSITAMIEALLAARRKRAG